MIRISWCSELLLSPFLLTATSPVGWWPLSLSLSAYGQQLPLVYGILFTPCNLSLIATSLRSMWVTTWMQSLHLFYIDTEVSNTDEEAETTEAGERKSKEAKRRRRRQLIDRQRHGADAFIAYCSTRHVETLTRLARNSLDRLRKRLAGLSCYLLTVFGADDRKHLATSRILKT